MGAGPGSSVQNLAGIEVAVQGNRWSDPNSFVGHPHVRGLMGREGEKGGEIGEGGSKRRQAKRKEEQQEGG